MNMNGIGWCLGAGALALAQFSSPVAADASSLTVRWVDAQGKTLEQRTLSTEELERMPAGEMRTKTPWTLAASVFTGPLIESIAALKHAKVTGIDVSALNDYSASLDPDDLEEVHPLLAVRQDGRTMRIRDKGPFWVIYPLDERPALQNQLTYSKMVWQVTSIVFHVR